MLLFTVTPSKRKKKKYVMKKMQSFYHILQCLDSLDRLLEPLVKLRCLLLQRLVQSVLRYAREVFHDALSGLQHELVVNEHHPLPTKQIRQSLPHHVAPLPVRLGPRGVLMVRCMNDVPQQVERRRYATSDN